MSAVLPSSPSVPAPASAPPAFLACLTTHRELVVNLIRRDVTTRYKQSVLGYAWAVLQPLITALILWVVGGILLKQSPGNGFPYPVYTFFGVLFWNLFQTGVLTGTESLVAHISLITKVYFPREVFPVSAAASKLVDFVFGLGGLAVFLVVFQVVPAVGMLAVVPLALLLALFAAGLGMLLSCANLFYRDVRYLVNLALTMLAYFVPNIYVLDTIPERFRTLYLLNPVAAILETARRLAFPATGPVEPVLPFAGIAAVTTLVTLVVGYVLFKRNEPRFAEFI